MAADSLNKAQARHHPSVRELAREPEGPSGGKIVPGRGGLLDRIDPLMFTSTATLIYARFILPL